MMWPFMFDQHRAKAFASEAKAMSIALNAMARKEATAAFNTRIEESLADGDRWIHRYVKNEPKLPPELQDPTSQEHITDPTEILKVHTNGWSEQWHTDKHDHIEEVRSTLGLNRERRVASLIWQPLVIDLL